MPHILVVDDNPTLRTMFRMMLENEGFEVVEASNGTDALRAFRAQPTDIVLCDLFMPEMDGLDLLRALTNEFPGVKVIAISGGGLKGKLTMLEVASQIGACEVLKKPFSKAHLLALVRKVLAR